MGTPTVSVTRKPDPPSPAAATRTLITFDLSIQIDRHSAAGVEAVARELSKLFQQSEGIFRMQDESGTASEWMVSSGGGTLVEPITGTANVWRVELQGSAPISAERIQDETASFTPTGGTAIFLHHIRDANFVITPERHTARFAARNLTTSTTTMTARVLHADPLLPYPDRMAQLYAKAAEMEALNVADGVLNFMGKSEVAQVQELRPVVDERKEVLDVVLQLKSYHLPGVEKVEANYQKNKSLDVSTGESVTAMRGTITADDYGTAMAKLNQIRDQGLNEKSRLTKFNHTLPCVMGADTGYAEAWTGTVEFDMEYRTHEGQCEGYELKISSDKEASGGYRRTYSGYVTAVTLAAAEAKARDLGYGKHPRWTRQNETSTEINARGAAGCEAVFTRLEFSYEYELVADYIETEFTMTRSKVSFGDRTASISGSITAATREICDDFQAKIIPLLIPESSGLTTKQLESRIVAFQCVETTRLSATAPSYAVEGQFIRRELQFGIRVWDRGDSVHVKYRKSDTLNYTSMQNSISMAGTIWADTEAKARAEYAAIVASYSLKITTEKFDVDLEKVNGEAANFVELTFSAEGVAAMTGVVGVDLLEAQWTLTRLGQYNHAAITEIPYNYPVVQHGIGWSTGQLRLQGSVRAVKQKTAIDYAQAKIPLIMGTYACETSAPEESLSPVLLPLSGGEVTGWNFQFSYARSYTRGLEGVWKATIPA